MTHILLDIKYKNTYPILFDTNRGESIIKDWCDYNNHLLVMPPISYIFPTYNERINNNEVKLDYPNLDCSYNGYTSIALLKESHISIHTYPEKNYIQIDFFSCKSLDKRQNIEYVERVFKKSDTLKFNLQFINRQYDD